MLYLSLNNGLSTFLGKSSKADLLFYSCLDLVFL